MGGGFTVEEPIKKIRANVSSFVTRDHIFKDSGYLTDDVFLVLTKDRSLRKLKLQFNHVRYQGELYPVLQQHYLKHMSSLLIQKRQGSPV